MLLDDEDEEIIEYPFTPHPDVRGYDYRFIFKVSDHSLGKSV